MITTIKRRYALVARALAIAITLGSPAVVTGQAVVPSDKVHSGDPCCNITAINLTTGIVTAVNQSRKTFRFQVALAAPKVSTTSIVPLNGITLLRSLKVGQKVYANFDTKKVSIDGITPCCDMLGTTARP